MRILFFILFCISFLISSENLKKISVQLEWKHQFEFAGFYAAIEKGYYKDIGLDVELKEYHSGTDIIDEVLKGKSTFGLSSSSLLLAKSNNLPVVLLASYFKENALALVTQKEIKSLTDLKNKKVMATSFEISQSSIGAMLKEVGLEKKDINFVEHDFSIEKFKNKEISAMSVFLTNQLYLLDKNNIEYNLFTPQNFGLFSYDLELFTSDDFVTNNYILVTNFIKATKKGWEYALENKDEIIDLIYEKYSKKKSKEALRFEAKKAEKLFKRDVFSIGSIAPELIKLNFDMYMKLGLIKEKININDLVEDYLFKEKDLKLLKYDFTKEELDFLKTNPIIKVQNEKEFPPYNYRFNNKPSGFSVEYMNLLASKIGLQLRYITGTWEETLNLIKKNELDIMLNTAKSLDKVKYLDYLEQPYISSKMVILANTQNKKLQNIKSLKGFKGKTLALIKGYLPEELIKKYYPNIKILSVKNPLEALKAVSYNKADGTLFGLMDVVDYYTNKYSIANVAPLFDVEDERFSVNLYIALNKNNKTLTSILNKVQNTLVETEVLALKNKMLSFNKNKKKVMLNCNPPQYMDQN